MKPMPAIAYLECSRCHHHVSIETRHHASMPPSVCPQDGGALLVRYAMETLRTAVRREHAAELAARCGSSVGMWRYAEVLPDVTPVTLGEGWTPLLQSRRNAGLMIKDEGANPTGTWEARGMAMAVAMIASMAENHAAGQRGAVHLLASSRGLAAYAAAGEMKAHLFLPRDLSLPEYLGAVVHGAEVHLVDGPPGECGLRLEEEIHRRQQAAGTASTDLWMDLSPLREPFRVEGDKTLGYELVEQIGWQYPDALLYPLCDAVGLIGVWKAFEEMEALGWVSGRRPRVYVGRTATSGLAAELESMILGIVTASGGRVVAVDDGANLVSLLDWAGKEGICLSLQGAAAAALHPLLLASGEIQPGQRIVLVNTAAGLKDADTISHAMPLRRPGSLPSSLPVGGIITPV